jgi:hypothetical protein
MRIGIEAQRLFRAKKHGMEVVAIEIIKQLQLMDRINEYIIFARPDADDAGIKETDNFKISGISSFTYADWEQIHLPLNVRKQSLDFLHCTCNTGPLFSPVPMMLTLHDIIFLETVNFKGTSYQNFGNCLSI